MGEHFTFFHYYKDTGNSTLESIFNRMNDISNYLSQDAYSTKDPYSWLEPDDPRRHLTDAEILRSQLSLRESSLTSKEKSHLMNMIFKYKKAFSL